MRIILVLSILSLYVSMTMAQQSSTIIFDHENGATDVAESKADTLIDEGQVAIWNKLNVNADPRIDTLLSIDIKHNERNVGIKGFRLQLYSGNKKQAYAFKSRFISKYPGYKAYVMFQTPDFHLKIGDFRTRTEALKLKYMIQEDFPHAFIVEDRINFPELEK